MTHKLLTRLALLVAVLTGPSIFVGCGEESKPAPDAAPAPSPAPAAPGDAPKADAPGAPK
jgi:hypothetical protein